jgi:hypothetical protein
VNRNYRRIQDEARARPLARIPPDVLRKSARGRVLERRVKAVPTRATRATCACDLVRGHATGTIGEFKMRLVVARWPAFVVTFSGSLLEDACWSAA